MEFNLPQEFVTKVTSDGNSESDFVGVPVWLGCDFTAEFLKERAIFKIKRQRFY